MPWTLDEVLSGASEVSRFGVPFASGIAFGPSYAILKGAREFHDWSTDPRNYKTDLDKYTMFGFLGIPTARLIDRWLISSGGVTLTEARVYLSTSNLAVKTFVGVPLVAAVGYSKTHEQHGGATGMLVGDSTGGVPVDAEHWSFFENPPSFSDIFSYVFR